MPGASVPRAARAGRARRPSTEAGEGLRAQTVPPACRRSDARFNDAKGESPKPPPPPAARRVPSARLGAKPRFQTKGHSIGFAYVKRAQRAEGERGGHADAQRTRKKTPPGLIKPGLIRQRPPSRRVNGKEKLRLHPACAVRSVRLNPRPSRRSSPESGGRPHPRRRRVAPRHSTERWSSSPNGSADWSLPPRASISSHR